MLYTILAIWLVLGFIGWAIASRRNGSKRTAAKAFIPCMLLGAVTFIAVIFFHKKSAS